MRYISLILSLVIIGYGIYFLAIASDSTGMGYGVVAHIDKKQLNTVFLGDQLDGE